MIYPITDTDKQSVPVAISKSYGALPSTTLSQPCSKNAATIFVSNATIAADIAKRTNAVLLDLPQLLQEANDGKGVFAFGVCEAAEQVKQLTGSGLPVDAVTCGQIVLRAAREQLHCAAVGRGWVSAQRSGSTPSSRLGLSLMSLRAFARMAATSKNLLTPLTDCENASRVQAEGIGNALPPLTALQAAENAYRAAAHAKRPSPCSWMRRLRDALRIANRNFELCQPNLR